MLKHLIVIVTMGMLAPASRAGDAGDPEQTCDGSTQEMVDCLAVKTARWDKRMSIAYQQALKDASPQQHDQLRAAQRLWIQYRDANGRGHDCPHPRRRMPAQHDRSSRPGA